MYFDLLRNNIVQNSSDDYYCTLCYEDMWTRYQVTDHFKYNRDHLRRQSSITDYVKETLMDISCDDIISVCIHYALACVCCDKVTPNCDSMLQHIRSAKHRKFYYNTIIDDDAIESVIKEITDDNTETVTFAIDPDNVHDYDEYIRKELSDDDCFTLVTNGVILWQYCKVTCDMCDKTFNEPYDIWQHMEAKHNLEVSEDGDEEDDDDYSDGDEEDDDDYSDDDDDDSCDDYSDVDDYLWCKLCDCKLPSELHISQHNNGRQHISNKLSKNGVILQDSTYFCTYCHREFESLNNTLLHIKGRYHKECYDPY